VNSSACFGTTLTESSSQTDPPRAARSLPRCVSPRRRPPETPRRRVAPSAHPGSPRTRCVVERRSQLSSLHSLPPYERSPVGGPSCWRTRGGPRRFRENQPLLEAGARDACADRGTKSTWIAHTIRGPAVSSAGGLPCSPTDRSAATRVALSELTPGRVTAALSAIQAGGAADKTRARLHGTLTGLFAYLIQQGLLEQDPLVSAGAASPETAH